VAVVTAVHQVNLVAMVSFIQRHVIVVDHLDRADKLEEVVQVVLRQVIQIFKVLVVVGGEC
tara:strand:- start:256 stop:438 length:183 start_codon:yes stop_codon:yes gene_type:complete